MNYNFTNPFSYVNPDNPEASIKIICDYVLADIAERYPNACVVFNMLFGFLYLESIPAQQSIYQMIALLNSLELEIDENKLFAASLFEESEFDLIREACEQYYELTDAERLTAVTKVRETLTKLGYITDYESGCFFVRPS